MKTGGWGVEQVNPPIKGMFIHTHVVPIGDLKPHSLLPHCWCNPVENLDDDIMQIAGRHFEHNAMDGREAFETYQRKFT